MSVLKLSRDRKVSPKAKFSSKRWTPEIPNAFGLPAHESCPGKTETCENICYAFRLERAYTSTANLLKHNLENLQATGDSVVKMEVLLTELVQEYLDSHNRIEKLRGETYKKAFRIHWDGDFYSINYAKAWAKVIKEFPEVSFWAYTRSFRSPVNVVPHLYNIDNLALYLSVDKDNLAEAKKITKKYPNVRVAALGTSFAVAASTIMHPSVGRNAPKCPEQTGRYALVEEGEGACIKCNMCVEGTNNVLFSISKK